MTDTQWEAAARRTGLYTYIYFLLDGSHTGRACQVFLGRLGMQWAWYGSGAYGGCPPPSPGWRRGSADELTDENYEFAWAGPACGGHRSADAPGATPATPRVVAVRGVRLGGLRVRRPPDLALISGAPPGGVDGSATAGTSLRGLGRRPTHPPSFPPPQGRALPRAPSARGAGNLRRPGILGRLLGPPWQSAKFRKSTLDHLDPA